MDSPQGESEGASQAHSQQEEDEEVPELTTFVARDAYVYAPLPPATSCGHRAEMWDVNKWLQARE